jgi:hypothetical protein
LVTRFGDPLQTLFGRIEPEQLVEIRLRRPAIQPEPFVIGIETVLGHPSPPLSVSAAVVGTSLQSDLLSPSGLL